ncbi:MAG: patatin-like phospholipase family protein [Clostridia bacterium]|nr:patatin-like phospholipase family protein [Clostridia bacterium]
MGYAFKNYVFEGGGVKGLAYVGALKMLDEKNIHSQIKRVAGASAGAICALLVALNYSTDEIKDILWKMDFRNFMDGDWGIIQDAARLIKDYGWYKGDFFKNWIETLINSKTGSKDTTFKDLHDHQDFKEVVFIGTNLSTHFSEIYSFETSPDMVIAEALRISMSIPLFFKAVQNNTQVYVDGGLLMNYPVKIFDRESYVEADNIDTKFYKPYYDKKNTYLRSNEETNQYVYNKETLGFRLDSNKEIAVFDHEMKPVINQIDSIFDYMWHLIKTITGAQENLHLHSDDWHRTVYIDTLGIQTTDFDISDEMKQKLVDSGYEHTKAYFEWFDDQTNEVENR